MQYKYLHSSEIDLQLWDSQLAKCPNRLVFAESWYLKEACVNWAAIVNDDYTELLPFAINKKMGISYIYAPWAAPRLGCFSINNKCNLAKMLEAIPKKFKVIEIVNNGLVNENPSAFKNTTRHNYIAHLNQPYETLRANYHYKTRNILKKAEKVNLKVKSIGAQEILQLFKSNTGKSLSHIKEKNYLDIKNIIEKSLQLKFGEVLGAFDDEQNLLAAIFSLKKNDRIVNLFVASNEMGKKIGAMTFLVDHIIKSNSQTNTVLDFAGSSIRSIARFNERFGAQLETYSFLQNNNLPALLKLFKR